MRPNRLLFAVIAVLAVIGGGVLVASRALSDQRPSMRGVRLGMTADEVRARVDALGEGTWTASSASGDWVLEHTSPSERATFELHDGQLMAIRVDSIAIGDLDGPSIEVTEGTVLHRHAAGGRIAWTLLSRTCPTHHAEAEALALSASSATP